MRYKKAGPRLLISILGTALVACGGGDGGPTVVGIDGTGSLRASAFGTISGFGSIIVNGVRFETTNATFTIDGQVGAQSDLAVGDVVLVQGTIASSGTDGTADSVSFDDNVEGPVSAIDRAAGTLVILGQLVRVTSDTSFDDSIQPSSLDGLSVGDVVEVTGLVDAVSVINATRLELKPAGGELEITGLVSMLDSGKNQFNINSLVVDFSSAMLDDFPSGSVSDGDLVEVKGDSLGGMDELIATRVEFKNPELSGNEDDHLEIEGFITRFVSPSDFDVSGFPVITNSQTRFEGGVAADLGLNVKVEVEGNIDGNGGFLVTEVDIRRAEALKVTALIDSVDDTDSFTTLGITVNVDLLTRIEDKTDLNLEPFGLSQLATGDYVQIVGAEFPAGSGRILAGGVEREDPDPETILQGFVTGFAEPTITVLGVTIETDAGTVFRDAAGAALSSTEFFAQLAQGTLVKAQGVEVSAQTIAADEVEIEIED